MTQGKPQAADAKCPRCNESNPVRALVCGTCGSRLPQTDTPAGVVNASVASPLPSPPPRSSGTSSYYASPDELKKKTDLTTILTEWVLPFAGLVLTCALVYFFVIARGHRVGLVGLVPIGWFVRLLLDRMFD